METASQLDSTKDHCNFTVESEYRESMRQLMANHKAPKNRLSQSQIMIKVWSDLDKQKEKLHQEIIISDDKEKANYIKQLVAKFGGFEPTDEKFIMGRKNANQTSGQIIRYTDCRQAGMYLTKKHTSLTLNQIGFIFFKKDHTTVLHANQKIKDMIATRDKFIIDMVKFVEEKLQAANYITEN